MKIRALAAVLSLCFAAPAAAQTNAPSPPAAAAATEVAGKSHGFARGTWELRPVVGMTGNLTGQEVGTTKRVGALQLGFDVFYHLGGATALLVGAWGSTDEGFIGAEAHVGVKHRFFGINPVVVPVILGGVGFQWGLPRAGADRRTVTGLGVRMGFGLDFQATPRVFPGIQFVLDVGPRFLPSVSVLATTQVVAGISFVL